MLPEVDAITAARRWSDGWRGGLLSTCDFDLGFYAPWFNELAINVDSDAILLIDPSSALVDPAMLDGLVAHGRSHPDSELCFVPAAPGLGGRCSVERCSSDLPQQRRTAGDCSTICRVNTVASHCPATCAPVPAPVARTTHRFKLDSDRQIARLSAATHNLNGQLISSGAEELVHRSHAWEAPDSLPREVTLELNTNRATARSGGPGLITRLLDRRCRLRWLAR